GSSTTRPSTETQPPLMYRSASMREHRARSATHLARRTGVVMVQATPRRVGAPVTTSLAAGVILFSTVRMLAPGLPDIVAHAARLRSGGNAFLRFNPRPAPRVPAGGSAQVRGRR